MTSLLLLSHYIIFLSTKSPLPLSFFFFFNDTATTEIYTLSLHDALPISSPSASMDSGGISGLEIRFVFFQVTSRSEEHTSELQSRSDLVCRLLLEKKKKIQKIRLIIINDELYS